MTTKTRQPIYVTKPFLPPLEEYVRYLEGIWENGVLTHNGPLLQRLERELAAYLGLQDLVCLSNGTIALQLAIRALKLQGEIITTPFSYVATAAAIAWERCTPVFADVDPETFNVDPRKIEERITPRTTAILGVHVFSNPCHVQAIDAIAKRHGLKVIYDAAHAVAVRTGGRSVLEYGDVSAVSLHATKLLSSAEGGGCAARDPELLRTIRQLRFFGFDEAKETVGEGMNGKMSEISAAMGLANLKWLDRIIANRRSKYGIYQQLLAGTPGLGFQRFDPDAYNYSYLPVVFDSEERLLKAVAALHADGIFPRRYFHPSLNTIPHYRQEGLPLSERLARTILCLPLYDGLPEADIERVCAGVKAA